MTSTGDRTAARLTDSRQWGHGALSPVIFPRRADMDSLDHPTRSALRRLARDLGRRKAEAQKARWIGPAPGSPLTGADWPSPEEIERNDDGSRDRNS